MVALARAKPKRAHPLRAVWRAQEPYGPSEHDREQAWEKAHEMAPAPGPASAEAAAGALGPLPLGRPGARPLDVLGEAYAAPAARRGTMGRK